MTGRERAGLGILGVLVIALVVGLVVMLRGGPDRPAPPPTHAATEPAPGPAVSSAARRPPVEVPTHAVPTELPVDSQGNRVHDHTQDPPSTDQHPVTSLTVATIRQAVNHDLQLCGAKLREASDPLNVRVTVHAQVRVAGGRARILTLTVSEAEKLPPDYLGCLKRVFAAVDTDVADSQVDVEETVHMPFNVP